MNIFYENVFHLMKLNVTFDKRCLVFVPFPDFFGKNCESTSLYYMSFYVLCLSIYIVLKEKEPFIPLTDFLPPFAHFNFASTSTSTA